MTGISIRPRCICVHIDRYIGIETTPQSASIYRSRDDSVVSTGISTSVAMEHMDINL